MGRCAILLGAIALISCSNDHKPEAAPSSSSAAPESTTTTSTTTTTVSPLAAIDGCPDPGPLAEPDARGAPRYSVGATVSVADGTVGGSVTISFVPDLPIDDVVLRLWANAPAKRSAGVDETVTELTVDDGSLLAVDRPDPTTVVIHLRGTHPANEPIAVTTDFRLSVPANSDDRIGRINDTMRLGSFLPLLAWEPGVGWAMDPPTTVHGEAATSPVSEYNITLDAVGGYEVLGTGEYAAPNHWSAHAVRDVGFVIGHFDVVEQDVGAVRATVGVARGVGEDPNRYLQPIVTALQHYQSRFSVYPWPTYTAAVLPGFHGGIEFPTFVMEGEGSALRSIVHELAHQWFYSLVGNDQGRDPWLDEGLASYVEFVEVGSLTRHMGDAIPSDARGHAGDPTTYWDHHESSYYAGVYVQPAVAIARLGSVDQVDCALRSYVAKRAYTIARPADLIAALATVFGDAPNRLAAYGLHP